MAVEGVAQPVGLGGRSEAEHREESPDAAPAMGEDAGPGGGAGGELEEDEDEDVVVERDEPVLACDGGGGIGGGGEPVALGGALAFYLDKPAVTPRRRHRPRRSN